MLWVGEYRRLDILKELELRGKCIYLIRVSIVFEDFDGDGVMIIRGFFKSINF